MSDGTVALTKGIFARLDGAVTYNASAVPVSTTYVTDATAFPYIVIYNASEVEDGTQGTNAQRFTLDVHVFDQGRTPAAVMTIAESIYDLLHRQESNITVTGFNLWQIQQQQSRFFAEDEDTTQRRIQHGVLTYDIGIQAN